MDIRRNMLKGYAQRYHEIMKKSSLLPYQRDIMLGQLMTEMEIRYRIPMLQDSVYDAQHLSIMKLYRQISYARDFNP